MKASSKDSTPQVFRQDRMVSVCKGITALFCCLTILGIPFGIWLFRSALCRIVISAETIQLYPWSTPLRKEDIVRWGVGEKRSLMRNPAKPLVSEYQGITITKFLIETKGPKRFVIPTGNFAFSLPESLRDFLGTRPQQDIQVSFISGRMRFQ